MKKLLKSGKEPPEKIIVKNPEAQTGLDIIYFQLKIENSVHPGTLSRALKIYITPIVGKISPRLKA